MEELTMKEKIDKVIDKYEELEECSKEYEIPFYADPKYGQVCFLKDSEIEYYSKLLERPIMTSVFARDTSKEYSHKKFFDYRGVEFYMLVAREEVDK